ncbi:MAG: hypothetical protein ABSF00_08485 [Candidatus Bathyarchaeia archaeon]
MSQVVKCSISMMFLVFLRSIPHKWLSVSTAWKKLLKSSGSLARNGTTILQELQDRLDKLEKTWDPKCYFLAAFQCWII